MQIVFKNHYHLGGSQVLLRKWYQMWGLPRWFSTVKNSCAMQEMQEMWAQSMGREDPLEEEIGTHSNILARRIPWTEEPNRLQSIGLQRVGHD